MVAQKKWRNWEQSSVNWWKQIVVVEERRPTNWMPTDWLSECKLGESERGAGWTSGTNEIRNSSNLTYTTQQFSLRPEFCSRVWRKYISKIQVKKFWNGFLIEYDNSEHRKCDSGQGESENWASDFCPSVELNSTQLVFQFSTWTINLGWSLLDRDN